MENKVATAQTYPASWFDDGCRRCARLAACLDEVRARHPEYHAAPVPPFGPADAPLLLVGLAPGMHGANRTGRPFTGDHAGILLYRTLFDLGLATAPESVAADDGLELLGCRITNAVKCLPPANKPLPAEVRECRRWLAPELAESRPQVVLALGRIAHDATLGALGLRRASWGFSHGARHRLPGGMVLFDSYHCSRYNTQTRRLTEPMFREVVGRAAEAAGVGQRT
ncbi:uracil-DNA glycosylase [Thioalkalivibrio sp. XN8]|uniref:uracil-DNA glycosylase n=1 Tax=Thioalkalivibrio sp. XN8 TaxID=2712863 RepID=UPI0013EB0D2E|nr:uracil-DNA glycosylase [Thioalkalivibrio sp. XN8]NGP54716.1 uracil-DNA glycosylase [Thioalkalivibrio sp. XN8]